MDGGRFDALARALANRADPTSRRGLIRGAFAAAIAAIAGSRADAEAAGSPTCSSGQVYRRGRGCICRTTGRPPGRTGCTACGENRTLCDGDCVDVRTDRDHCGGCDQPCRARHACETATCRVGSCQHEPIPCPPPGVCQENDGVCDPSTGLCGYTPRTGAPCGPAASCAGDVRTAQGVCDASGVCQPGVAASCAPYRCDDDGLSCRTTCRADEDCLPSHHCDEIVAGEGSCFPDLDVGSPCDEPSDCADGLHCVEGVCCDRLCAPCGTCTLPGSIGTCIANPVATCALCYDCDLDSGQCVVADGGFCEPDNARFTAGVCQSGGCIGTTTIDCPPRTPCELPGVCNPNSEACEYEDATNGAGCAPEGGGDGRCCDGTCCPGISGCCANGDCAPTCAAPLVVDAARCDCVCPAERVCGAACCADGTSCADAESSVCCESGNACPFGSGAICCPGADDGCYYDQAVGRALCCSAESRACEVGADFFCCENDNVCVPDGSGGHCCPPCENGTEPQGNCVCCEVGETACPDGSCCGECQICSPLGDGCVPATESGPISCTLADPCLLDGACSDGECVPLGAVSCPDCQICDSSNGACAPVLDGTPVELLDPCGDICLNGAVVERPGCGECETCEIVTGTCAPITGQTCALGMCCGGACCPTGVCCAAGDCAPLCDAPYVADLELCACACPNECCADIDCSLCHTCDTTIGQCQQVDNGISCDDGDLCTSETICILGNCVGTPTECGLCQTCDPATGSCVADDGASCENADACLGPGICAAGVCQPISPVVCPDCATCDPGSGSCLPSSVGVCTPDGGVAATGTCCQGACCAPGTECQGTSCVPITCPTCQAFDSSVGACAPIDDGITCLAEDSTFSQCCDGACCPPGKSCVAGACCDNFLVCNGVCCDRCEMCQAGTCVPLGEGVQCGFLFGIQYTCCDGVCCQVDTCAADVCGVLYEEP